MTGRLHNSGEGPRHTRSLLGTASRTLGVLLSVVTLHACAPRAPASAPESRVHRDEVLFGLSFEERMAIPPALSRLRAEAQHRADEIYDPFRSKVDAVRNEEFFAQLAAESRKKLLASKGLTEADVELILEEYQSSLGANLR